MKKVSELEGAELDYWVAQVEGLKVKIIGNSCYLESGGPYRPSSDWALAGSIVDKAKIGGIAPARNGSAWEAAAYGKNSRSTKPQSGATARIAIARAYVASKFGDEVPED